jgi:hypothetical protein
MLTWLVRNWFLFIVFVFLLVGFRCSSQWSVQGKMYITFTRFVLFVMALVSVMVFGSPLIRAGQEALCAPLMFRIALGPSSLQSTLAAPSPVVQRAGAFPAPWGTSVLGGPSLSASFMDEVLAHYHSPAAGTGEALYEDSVRYGIDDAFAMAFFWHESNFGVNGEATATHSLGNLRCISGAACVDQDRGGYAAFPDWPTGYNSWYVLIKGPLYVGDGRTTVETIIPRYAPSGDRNNEHAYIANVMSVVAQLRAGHVVLA